LFFLVLVAVAIDNVRRCFVVSTQLIAVVTVATFFCIFEDCFLFFRAPKERFRLAFSLDAPLVIHFVIVDDIMVMVCCCGGGLVHVHLSRLLPDCHRCVVGGEGQGLFALVLAEECVINLTACEEQYVRTYLPTHSRTCEKLM
jgi:hypothetical protein